MLLLGLHPILPGETSLILGRLSHSFFANSPLLQNELMTSTSLPIPGNFRFLTDAGSIGCMNSSDARMCSSAWHCTSTVPSNFPMQETVHRRGNEKSRSKFRACFFFLVLSVQAFSTLSSLSGRFLVTSIDVEGSTSEGFPIMS